MSAPTTKEASAARPNLNAEEIAKIIILARQALKEGSGFSEINKLVQGNYEFPKRSTDHSRILANKAQNLITSISQKGQLKSEHDKFAGKVVKVVLQIINNPSCKEQFLLEQINGNAKEMKTEKDLTKILSQTITLREGSEKVDTKTQGHGHESAA